VLNAEHEVRVVRIRMKAAFTPYSTARQARVLAMFEVDRDDDVRVFDLRHLGGDLLHLESASICSIARIESKTKRSAWSTA
jgi:hypothetical protein